MQPLTGGGGGLCGGNISPWDISRFKFVRTFPRNFQAVVRNKPAAKFSKMSCPTVAYATPLAMAGFASMAELALITSKSLKACKVLDGHALRIVDELKKRHALGVVPPKKPSKRPADIPSFMDLSKKRQKKEART